MGDGDAWWRGGDAGGGRWRRRSRRGSDGVRRAATRTSRSRTTATAMCMASAGVATTATVGMTMSTTATRRMRRGAATPAWTAVDTRQGGGQQALARATPAEARTGRSTQSVLGGPDRDGAHTDVPARIQAMDGDAGDERGRRGPAGPEQSLVMRLVHEQNARDRHVLCVGFLDLGSFFMSDPVLRRRREHDQRLDRRIATGLRLLLGGRESLRAGDEDWAEEQARTGSDTAASAEENGADPTRDRKDTGPADIRKCTRRRPAA
mmetsp:Transcript_58630/g.154045  ORF Transcript_58630/g.154045 Transcript_58630/m.154045 type:complete len:264 (-) Transcript_58630:173-964(-)